MSFRLWTIFYLFALISAAMATFGGGGIIFAAVVLAFWAWYFYPRVRRNGVFTALLATGTLFVLAAVILPFISNARSAFLRNHCMSHLKQVAAAIHAYHDQNGSFPPAYVADANGKPMHSWRVLILPYLGEDALYKQYSFAEPWNGPNNSKLSTQIPEVYRCPAHHGPKNSSQVETHYFAIIGAGTIWPGEKTAKRADVKDGLSNSILLIEAGDVGVNWMEPRDVSMDEAIVLLAGTPRLGHHHVDEWFFGTTYFESANRHVALADGRVTYMFPLEYPNRASALLTIDGGEDRDDLGPRVNASNLKLELKTHTVINWPRIYGLTVFLLLSVLPLARKRTRTVNMAT